MVHGTNGYRGEWWFPGGDFHTYIKEYVRPDLFSGGNCYSWSGKYNKRDRRIAAERLAFWVEATVGGPLDAVFAHSFGGIVALQATTYGLELSDLILLSVPVDDVPIEWRNIGRAISLRIHLDLVLLAARRRQCFTENVDEHYINHWFRAHGDSHDPSVWQADSWPTILGL